MKKIYSNNYFTEFKKVARKINALSSNWEEVPTNEKESLIKQLTRYYNSVKNKYSKRSLAKVLGAASIFISSFGVSQTFTTPVTQPFGITANSSGLFANEFVDIDGDGDLDLFTNAYYSANLVYQENTGTAAAPVFGPIQLNPFGFTVNTSVYSEISMVNLADIDNDGDLDLFVNGYYMGDLWYWENTGTATSPAFGTLVKNPFGVTTTYQFLQDVADVDNDGDLDIVFFDANTTNTFMFFENIGNPTSPTFAAGVSDPFGILSASSSPLIGLDFVDFDNDGDLDIFKHELGYTGNKFYQENTGITGPAFSADQINPFNLPADTNGIAPEMVDIDGDGDIDMFLSTYGGATLYFENVSPASIKEGSTIEFSIFPNPTSNTLTIKGAELNSTFEIYTIDGRQVLTGILSSANIDVSRLEKGKYLFKLINEYTQQTISFNKI